MVGLAEYPVHYILFIPPSVGVVGLAEYVCTHPCLIFIEKDPDFIPEDVE